MNLTPIGALEIIAFDASVCHDGPDFDNLLERIRQLNKALGIQRPNIEQYDKLRLALSEKLAQRAAQLMAAGGAS